MLGNRYIHVLPFSIIISARKVMYPCRMAAEYLANYLKLFLYI
jgi:hypothetical protein